MFDRVFPDNILLPKVEVLLELRSLSLRSITHPASDITPLSLLHIDHAEDNDARANAVALDGLAHALTCGTREVLVTFGEELASVGELHPLSDVGT